MIRIDGNPLGQTGLNQASTHGQAQTQARTGSFQGELATVKDAASTLADAAEEISLHNSEKAEQKRFGERQCKAEQSFAVLQAQEIMAYLEAAQTYDDPQKLAALAKRMQSGQENPRELARQQSRDPAQQYMLMQYALQDGERGGASPEALEELRDALADLEMESGPQIRAGVNSIGAAGEYAQDAGDIARFQATYQDVVLGHPSLAQTLQLVLDRLGGPDGEDFTRGLQGLIKALGADLASARPSQDGNRLQALVQDLYQLEVTATVLDACKELNATLGERFGARGFEPVQLMKELVAISGEKWVSASRFTGLADRLGVSDGANGVGASIGFQTAVKVMVRDLPVKVFADADVRQTILNAVQEALDQAIDQEEE